MVEQGTRVDRLVSIDVVERFEALQDEVDLLKNEIKQTLIDMREHMMKDRTVFAQPEVEPRRGTPSPLPPRVVYGKETPAPARSNGHSPMHLFGPFGPGSHGEGMDAVMMGKVIQWLGTVQQRGLKLQQVTPFLEAYEASGYLPPIMLKVLLRSLADLDQLTGEPTEDEFSAERYSECIGELHDIICAADSHEEQAAGPTDAYSESGLEEISPEETGPEETGQTEQVDDGPAEGKFNWHSAGETGNPDTGRYNLTTIQVPELENDSENPVEGSPNG